jgi:toxin ParE1/3/4
MIRFAPDAVSDIERVRQFLDVRNPDAARRAMRTIWSALERVQDIPELGRRTEDDSIRQIIIRFGAAGYVCAIHDPSWQRGHLGAAHLARPRG